MTCDHDYRENPVVETTRFFTNVATFGFIDDIAPRKCRKCGREEP